MHARYASRGGRRQSPRFDAQLAPRAAARVLLSREAGSYRGDDGAEACRCCIGCEQFGSRHVEVGLETGRAMRRRDEAVTGARGERPRANNAAVEGRAREHPELRVEAGTMTGRPSTGVWPAASNTDRLAKAEVVAVSGRKPRGMRPAVEIQQHLLTAARSPELRRRRRLSTDRSRHQQAEAAQEERRCRQAHRPYRLTFGAKYETARALVRNV